MSFRSVPFTMLLKLTETARVRFLLRILTAYDCLSVCKGLLLEQEPMFTYKSITFLDDPGTSLWAVVYTERVVRFCAALLLAAYSEYRPWFVTTDIIVFSRELGFTM